MSGQLLGILLVCYSARGHQLVFSHPPAVSSPKAPNGAPNGGLFEPVFLSHLLSPRSPLCDRLFKLLVDQVAFVGHATLLNADRPGTGHQFSRAIQRRRATMSTIPPEGNTSPTAVVTSTTNHHLTMFHLVLAVRCDSDDSYLDALYTNVVSKVASALKYEQLRRLYIRKEAELILSIKEDAALLSMLQVAWFDAQLTLSQTRIRRHKFWKRLRSPGH